ncbi:hypothetical protein [Streptomyces sp. TP-A0874]|uniref:hypothetical protein n=1 Tax=Streptomyces sp. TP-A0874 TaxID=549819 RepID=UPI0008538DF9|nr:hypothetical protein [Streptomyces sp. TP-A0874]
MTGRDYGPDGPEHPEGRGESAGPEPERLDGRTGEPGRPSGGDPLERDPLSRNSPSQDPEGQDEDSLRRLFQAVVEDIEPDPGSLEHLRRAVAARRARKRQAFVGAAAALLFAGCAVPALVHMTDTGSGSDRRTNTASSQRAHGGAEGAEGDQDTGGGSSTAGGDPSGGRGGEGKPGGPGQHPGSGEHGGASPTESMSVSTPSCSRDQLGAGSASLSPADADGRVYGKFRVVNVSNADCTIDDVGGVLATAQGSADISRISVVEHTAGDEAPGLPDPSSGDETLILGAGKAYVVKFAWVPADGGSGGCSSDPGSSPDPGGSGGSGGAGNSPEQSEDDGRPEEPAEPTPGSVVLSHTPEGGDPAVASTRIDHACAGTVYHTGVLATS